MIKGCKFLGCGGFVPSKKIFTKASATQQQQQQQQQQIAKNELTITRPDDWHLHLRDGKFMESAVIHSATRFGRAIIMPNLVPPITTVKMALDYKQRILTAIQKYLEDKNKMQNYLEQHSMNLSANLNNFQPLMTLYLTDSTTPNEIEKAKKEGIMGVKLYPAGATTNSDSGVTDIKKVHQTLKYMSEIGMPLLIHGEVTGPQVDMFDREKQFLEQVLRPLLDVLPDLKVVLEHVSTKDAVEFVMSCGENVAATVTPQHLLLNRNAIFNKGLNPHHFCLPILKREEHRLAVVDAVTSGSGKFFLGTDSAPHTVESKECSCGCAGIFNASVALPIYLEMFEQMSAIQHFESFASLNGSRFYGVAPNNDQVTFKKDSWFVPAYYEFGDSSVVPLRGGEYLKWRMC